MSSFRPSHRQLEYLVAIGKTGSFSEAARLCHVSQPTLSTQIQILEDRLQATLIERSRNGAWPTPIGNRIVEQAEMVLQGLTQIMETAASTSESLAGRLKLGVGPTFGPYFLPHLLPAIKTLYSELDILISEGRVEEFTDNIINGNIDCAITCPLIDKANIVSEEFYDEPMWIGLPVDHPLARHNILLPEMLKGERFFGLDYSSTYIHKKLVEFCEAIGADIHRDYVGSNLDALRQMVTLGKGLTFFPEYYVASEFTKESRVVLREVKGYPLFRPIALLWRQGSCREHHYRNLLDACKGCLQDHVTKLEDFTLS
jgi:LysR family transcriptional regulator, hydrogen peroxide-inducible genes activator